MGTLALGTGESPSKRDFECFVTQGCYEPTLTIMAVSARAAEYIGDQYRRGEL